MRFLIILLLVLFFASAQGIVPFPISDQDSMFYISPAKVNAKTDTILVPVLCIQYTKACEDCIQFSNGEVRLQHKSQERTLEWQTWSEGSPADKNGLEIGLNIIKSGWVVTKTSWLDPVDGCYQLIPIEK